MNRNPTPATAASGTGKPELKASRSIPPAGLHLLLENTVRISASFGALCRQAELQQSGHPPPPNPAPSTPQYPAGTPLCAAGTACSLLSPQPPSLPRWGRSSVAFRALCSLVLSCLKVPLLPLGQILPESCVSHSLHFSAKVGNIQVSNRTIGLSLDPFCTTPPSMAP